MLDVRTRLEIELKNKQKFHENGFRYLFLKSFCTTFTNQTYPIAILEKCSEEQTSKTSNLSNNFKRKTSNFKERLLLKIIPLFFKKKPQHVNCMDTDQILAIQITPKSASVQCNFAFLPPVLTFYASSESEKSLPDCFITSTSDQVNGMSHLSIVFNTINSKNHKENLKIIQQYRNKRYYLTKYILIYISGRERERRIAFHVAEQP